MTSPSEQQERPVDLPVDDAAVEAEHSPPKPAPKPIYDDDPYDVARERREHWEREDERLEEDR